MLPGGLFADTTPAVGAPLERNNTRKEITCDTLLLVGGSENSLQPVAELGVNAARNIGKEPG